MFRRPRRPSAPAIGRDDGRAETSGGDDLLTLLTAIEQSALDIYARHGLPRAPGHYRRRREDEAWELLGEDMDVAARWAMVDVGDGWRYASLEALGAHAAQVEVRQASAMLSACKGLRQRLAGRAPVTPQDLADSIRLGAAWRAREAPSALPADSSPLSFRPPLDETRTDP